MSKALVIGNGKSRAWFKPCHQTIMDDNVMTWGCNAIYREGPVDNLVAIDNAMKYEIHESGYPKKHKCWFTSWSFIDSTVVPIIKMDLGVPEYFIHENENKTPSCVIHEYKSNKLQGLIDEILQEHPKYTMDDIKNHLISKDFKYKDAGYWISYVSEEDNIESVDEEFYSAGCMAVSLACKEGAKEVYMIGFDLHNADSVYQGTNAYMLENTKFTDNSKEQLLSSWIKCLSSVFDKYKGVMFYWVDCQITGVSSWHGSTVKDYHSNVRFLTKNQLCDTIKIL